MFERFSDRARRVVVLAQESARINKNDVITVEHLLIGLIHEGEGVATQILLAHCDVVTMDELLVEALPAPVNDATISGHIPFSARAKKVLELSLREALQLGHAYIGTEHLLLAIMREEGSAASRILGDSEVTLAMARADIVSLHNTGRIAIPGDLVAPSGEAYPEIVQAFAAKLEAGDALSRDDLVEALEAAARQRAAQARGAFARALRAHLDLLSAQA